MIFGHFDENNSRIKPESINEFSGRKEAPMGNNLRIDGSPSDPNSALQVFNLSSLTSHLKTGSEWSSQDRTKFTLIQIPGLHIVLIAMHAGTTKTWHKVECPISLQMLEGSVDFITDSETVTLKQGDILTLKEGIRHHMSVIEESVVLLSLGRQLG